MVTKTKAELEAEIKKLKTQLDDAKKAEKHDEMATELHNMYLSLVKAGFTEEQSWDLTYTIVENGVKLNH